MSATTTGRYATEQGEKLLRGVTAQISLAIKSPGVAEVHDLRVAIRRFIRILVVLKPCFPRSESRRIRRGLKGIMVQAGSVRDYDIAMRLLARMPLSESGAPIPATIADWLRERREEAARTLAASLRRWVERNLPASWRKAGVSAGGHKGADARFCATRVDAAARRILPEMAKELFRRGKDAARGKASAEELHRFRIAAKNLRYTLDFFAPLYGASSLAGLRDQLKGLQSQLGEINDCATVRRMLSRRKITSHKDDAGSKEILAALKKRQRKKMEQFQQHYAAGFLSAGTLRRWKETLSARAATRPERAPSPKKRVAVRKRAVKKSAVRKAAAA